MRLVGALLLEQNDEWALCRRYMSLETLAGSATILLSACQRLQTDSFQLAGDDDPPTASYTTSRDTISKFVIGLLYSGFVVNPYGFGTSGSSVGPLVTGGPGRPS